MRGDLLADHSAQAWTTYCTAQRRNVQKYMRENVFYIDILSALIYHYDKKMQGVEIYGI